MKIEQGDAALADPHHETHQLPHLPEVVTEGEPVIPTNKEKPPTAIDLVWEQPSFSTGVSHILIAFN